MPVRHSSLAAASWIRVEAPCHLAEERLIGQPPLPRRRHLTVGNHPHLRRDELSDSEMRGRHRRRAPSPSRQRISSPESDVRARRRTRRRVRHSHVISGL